MVIALTGVFLNARGKWQGFLFWLVSNVCWCWHNIKLGEYAQAVLFAVCWVLTVYGIWCWRWRGKRSLTYGQHRAAVVAFCERIVRLKNLDGKAKVNWIIEDAERILKKLGGR